MSNIDKQHRLLKESWKRMQERLLKNFEYPIGLPQGPENAPKDITDIAKKFIVDQLSLDSQGKVKTTENEWGVTDFGTFKNGHYKVTLENKREDLKQYNDDETYKVYVIIQTGKVTVYDRISAEREKEYKSRSEYVAKHNYSENQLLKEAWNDIRERIHTSNNAKEEINDILSQYISENERGKETLEFLLNSVTKATKVDGWEFLEIYMGDHYVGILPKDGHEFSTNIIFRNNKYNKDAKIIIPTMLFENENDLLEPQFNLGNKRKWSLYTLGKVSKSVDIMKKEPFFPSNASLYTPNIEKKKSEIEKRAIKIAKAIIKRKGGKITSELLDWVTEKIRKGEFDFF